MTSQIYFNTPLIRFRFPIFRLFFFFYIILLYYINLLVLPNSPHSKYIFVIALSLFICTITTIMLLLFPLLLTKKSKNNITTLSLQLERPSNQGGTESENGVKT